MHGTVLAYAHAQSFGANETIGRRIDDFRTSKMHVCLYVAVQFHDYNKKRVPHSLPYIYQQALELSSNH
jgi:hypothetical protein